MNSTDVLALRRWHHTSKLAIFVSTAEPVVRVAGCAILLGPEVDVGKLWPRLQAGSHVLFVSLIEICKAGLNLFYNLNLGHIEDKHWAIVT